MSLTRRGSAKRRHMSRKAWLEPVLASYQDVPGIHDDVTDSNRAALERLVNVMTTCGLFGASSVEMRRETVRRLLSELRGEDVGNGW